MARVGLRVPSGSGTVAGTRWVDIDQGGELVMAGASYEFSGDRRAVGGDLGVVIAILGMR